MFALFFFRSFNILMIFTDDDDGHEWLWVWSSFVWCLIFYLVLKMVQFFFRWFRFFCLEWMMQKMYNDDDDDENLKGSKIVRIFSSNTKYSANKWKVYISSFFSVFYLCFRVHNGNDCCCCCCWMSEMQKKNNEKQKKNHTNIDFF